MTERVKGIPTCREWWMRGHGGSGGQLEWMAEGELEWNERLRVGEGVEWKD